MKAAIRLADPIEALNTRARAKGWTFTCDRSAKFDAAKLNAACALWESLAAPGVLPARSAFGARAMKDFLPDLSIMEIVPTAQGNRFRHRFIGTNVVRYMGEMTDTFLDEYLPPSALERTALSYQAVIDARCPLRFVTRFALHRVDYLSAEIFGAPLASDGTTPDMMMAVTDFRRPASS